MGPYSKTRDLWFYRTEKEGKKKKKEGEKVGNFGKKDPDPGFACKNPEATQTLKKAFAALQKSKVSLKQREKGRKGGPQPGGPKTCDVRLVVGPNHVFFGTRNRVDMDIRKTDTKSCLMKKAGRLGQTEIRKRMKKPPDQKKRSKLIPGTKSDVGRREKGGIENNNLGEPIGPGGKVKRTKGEWDPGPTSECLRVGGHLPERKPFAFKKNPEKGDCTGRTKEEKTHVPEKTFGIRWEKTQGGVFWWFGVPHIKTPHQPERTSLPRTK